jgi:hypothetical protein
MMLESEVIPETVDKKCHEEIEIAQCTSILVPN